MGAELFKSLADSDTIPSSKKARLILTVHSLLPPIVEIILSKQAPNVTEDVTVENKLRSVQLKTIHNIILPTNLSLCKMNIKETPRCEHCLF